VEETGQNRSKPFAYIFINCDLYIVQNRQGTTWSYGSWISITANFLSSHPANDKVYSIQRYVINFVSDLRQVGGLLLFVRFPPQLPYDQVVPCLFCTIYNSQLINIYANDQSAMRLPNYDVLRTSTQLELLNLFRCLEFDWTMKDKWNECNVICTTLKRILWGVGISLSKKNNITKDTIKNK
jgi:hypothetical protein